MLEGCWILALLDQEIRILGGLEIGGLENKGIFRVSACIYSAVSYLVANIIYFM